VTWDLGSGIGIKIRIKMQNAGRRTRSSLRVGQPERNKEKLRSPLTAPVRKCGVIFLQGRSSKLVARLETGVAWSCALASNATTTFGLNKNDGFSAVTTGPCY
jgi:hypothetical protein